MAKRAVSELFVSRLSFYTTTEELRRLFSPFGVVKQARLIEDPRTQRHKGFGFVKFGSEIEARNALKAMNGRRELLAFGSRIETTKRQIWSEFYSGWAVDICGVCGGKQHPEDTPILTICTNEYRCCYADFSSFLFKARTASHWCEEAEVARCPLG